MKLLLTGAFQYTEKQIKILQNMGHDLYYIQDERISLDEQTTTIPVEEIEGVVCNALFMYSDISQFKKLRFIQVTSAGYDRIPMNYIKEKQIHIYNAKGVYSKPMAEWAILAVLALYKKVFVFRNNQNKRLWEKQRNLPELTDKTVLIIGCGNVACEVAKIFKVFGTTIIGIDKYPRNEDGFDEMLGLEEIDASLRKADIVILTVPLTEETYHLINAKRLGLLKEDAILINISRGKIIDESALCVALHKKKIAGAALDVFEEEPLAEESLLWDMEQVIVTPHNSFVSDKNNERMFRLMVENLKGDTRYEC